MLELPTNMRVSSILIFTTILCLACKTHTNSDQVALTAMQEGLSNSIKSINASTVQKLFVLFRRTNDPANTYRASIWYPKAQLIQQCSKKLIDYIDSLKNKLLESHLNYNDLESSDKELHEQLKTYKSAILKADKIIGQTFKDYHFPSLLANDPSYKKTEDVEGLQKVSRPFIIPLLMKLQNDISVMENNIITFCLEQAPNNSDSFSIYKTIIGQSSSYVKGGESIEIFAGVGSFTRNAKPTFWIAGREIPISETGVAMYKFKTDTVPGNYSISVKIIYVDVNGKTVVVKKKIDYMVGVRPNLPLTLPLFQ